MTHFEKNDTDNILQDTCYSYNKVKYLAIDKHNYRIIFKHKIKELCITNVMSHIYHKDMIAHTRVIKVKDGLFIFDSSDDNKMINIQKFVCATFEELYKFGDYISRDVVMLLLLCSRFGINKKLNYN